MATIRIASALAVLSLAGLPANAQDPAWIIQLGSSDSDESHAIAPDGLGGVYVGGFTTGDLGGTNPSKYSDAGLAHIDGMGNQTWIRQFGTSSDEWMGAAAADGSGGVFVTGDTEGSLGGPNAGNLDYWLARYDSSGNLTWLRQFGSSGTDQALDLSPAESDGAFVCGQTYGSLIGHNSGSSDAWLARYDAAGKLQWLRHIVTPKADRAFAVVSDGLSGVYVCGLTEGNLGGQSSGSSDAWLARYDGTGSQIWIRQFGTSAAEQAWAAATDGSGGVYVTGYTAGSLGGHHVGGLDAWLAHYDGSGNCTWVRQFGTPDDDYTPAAASDSSGGVFLGGHTLGSFIGTNAGSADAWIAHYDPDGTLAWIRQFGTIEAEYVRAAVADEVGGLYVGGGTNGVLAGPNYGGEDAWIARYVRSPHTYCTAKTSSCGMLPTIGYTGTPSATRSSGFTIAAARTKAGRFGLLLHSPNGRANNPFSGGYLCMSAVDLRRSIAVGDTTGTPPQCDGVLSIDMNAFAQGLLGGNPQPFLLTPGQQVNCQFWGRDTLANGALLTDALEYFVGM